jgi:hypothetical protein
MTMSVAVTTMELGCFGGPELNMRDFRLHLVGQMFSVDRAVEAYWHGNRSCFGFCYVDRHRSW